MQGDQHMSRYGFFGGSFNPPTKAHYYLAEKVIETVNLDKLFFVPVGNYYKKDGLVDEKYRYEMLKLMCSKNEKMEVLDIELNVHKQLKAIDAFKMIKYKYPKDNLYYIMGADNLAKISKWESSEELIKNFKFIILNRGNYVIEDIIKNNSLLLEHKNNFIELENNEHSNTSSTDVRNKIKSKDMNIDILDEVQTYIKENRLY